MQQLILNTKLFKICMLGFDLFFSSAIWIFSMPIIIIKEAIQKCTVCQFHTFLFSFFIMMQYTNCKLLLLAGKYVLLLPPRLTLSILRFGQIIFINHLNLCKSNVIHIFELIFLIVKDNCLPAYLERGYQYYF